MTKYEVLLYVPYEGDSTLFEGTAEEIEEFFKKKDHSFWNYHYADDISIVEVRDDIKDSLNLHELRREALK
ncbi:MAG: hypothetical protein Unbinned2691contig1000_28 [Prokaryotic dsDNA virus sp.]|nr:MAG: hypothetical protein Unbinned2691contig1000_28 [Prokaryotic dsDNA virus sp.]|tara:strand:+ start:1956 stop:2168 length:213 start_codon:yes stop_codon:yes gene_type:complete